ncbi:hypothetical protein NEOC65_002231 [Neochlamydia sp. AcF65]|nr:hypothetical protein [Neochlamydia sp. AcF65]MBS4170273.1 hypothetical protein [Neochlamydia sp. AcF95]
MAHYQRQFAKDLISKRKKESLMNHPIGPHSSPSSEPLQIKKPKKA